ncbi:ArsR/SmtB family transcription factor [Deferribacter abyssi]|uniref:ArsR/SmtB family transcription factor n=1 Tax=Deferribacter abyssi TaxID=213806 RepID=UPI003C143195
MSNYDIYAEKLKILGHPIRLQLVHGLSKKECNVTKISEMMSIPQAIISRHLSLLKNAGIVEGERDKNIICYKVIDGKIKKIVDILMEGEE